MLPGEQHNGGAARPRDGLPSAVVAGGSGHGRGAASSRTGTGLPGRVSHQDQRPGTHSWSTGEVLTLAPGRISDQTWLRRAAGIVVPKGPFPCPSMHPKVLLPDIRGGVGKP